MRLIRFIAPVLACALYVAGASPALGDSAYNERDNSGPTLYGTRSEIKTPGYNISWGSTSGDWAGAFVVANGPDLTYDATAGWAVSSDSTGGVGGCSARTSYHAFLSWSSSSMGISCAWFGALGTASNDQYAAKRVADDPPVCSSECWALAIDGTTEEVESLDFTSANYVATTAGFFSVDKTLDAAFGFDDSTDWQRLGSVGGADWTTITGRTSYLQPTGWTVPAPPTPFTIKHS
jgi:hypothetical protein